MDWFLYDDGLRHERVKILYGKKRICILYYFFYFSCLPYNRYYFQSREVALQKCTYEKVF